MPKKAFARLGRTRGDALPWQRKEKPRWRGKLHEFSAVDAYCRLVTRLARRPEESPQQRLALFGRALVAIVRTAMRDTDERGPQFNPKPYFVRAELLAQRNESAGCGVGLVASASFGCVCFRFVGVAAHARSWICVRVVGTRVASMLHAEITLGPRRKRSSVVATFDLRRVEVSRTVLVRV